jgi:hypothetical protein
MRHELLQYRTTWFGAVLSHPAARVDDFGLGLAEFGYAMDYSAMAQEAAQHLP